MNRTLRIALAVIFFPILSITVYAGEFQEPLQFPTGDAPHSIHVADFNGDGKPDLVTVDVFSNTVSILLGQGDGTFPVFTDYPVANGADVAAVGDFNGDGRP